MKIVEKVLNKPPECLEDYFEPFIEDKAKASLTVESHGDPAAVEKLFKEIKLTGRLYFYHYTRGGKASAVPDLIKSRFEQAGNGAWLLKLGTMPPLSYTVRLAVLDSPIKRIFGHSELRDGEGRCLEVNSLQFSIPAVSEPGGKIDTIYGAWLGADLEGGDCASRVMISSRDFGKNWEVEVAKLFSEQKRNLWATPYHTTVLDGWGMDSINEAFLHSSHGETIRILSSFYTKVNPLKAVLEKLETKLPIPRKGEKKLKITIMILDPNCPVAVARRAVMNTFQDEQPIVDAIGVLNELRSALSGKINLEICLYDHWPFGLFFQFGTRVTFYGILLAHCIAIEGPMLVCRDPESQVWKSLGNSFKRVHEDWKAKHPELTDAAKGD